MTAQELLDRAQQLLAIEFGERASKDICLSVYTNACFYIPESWHPKGRTELAQSISVVGANCKPQIPDISHVVDDDSSGVLERFERETIPAIRKAWNGSQCGYDPVMLGC